MHQLSTPSAAAAVSWLLTHGFVARRKDGLYAWYRLADQHVSQLCDVMCGSLQRDLAARCMLLSTG